MLLCASARRRVKSTGGHGGTALTDDVAGWEAVDGGSSDGCTAAALVIGCSMLLGDG